MKNALRLGYRRYFSDDEFNKNLKFVQSNINVIDEITLFVEYSHHGFWDLNQQTIVSNVLQKRIIAYKKLGIKKVGINVLSTIGHLDESWDFLPKPTMQTMVGDDGKVSKCCLCINSKQYKEYIAERYKILAKCNPDFIWIDDDFRLLWHGVTNPCFCKNCIALFNKKYGHSFTFEQLSKQIKDDICIKNEYDEFRENSFVELANLIKESIYEINDNINIGYMSFPLNVKKSWIDAFDTKMLRPGGGFYNDDTPSDSLKKAYSVGSQIAKYPANINDIQYEFENFPYQTLCKSMKISELECALSLSYGCNGILYNAMLFYDYPKLMSLIKNKNNYWQKIVEYNTNLKNIGIYGDADVLENLIELGVPLSCDECNADVIILTGEKSIINLSENQIHELLKKSLIIDGAAFEALDKRGFGKYCGVKIDKIFTNGTNERFTNHKFNLPFADYKRDIFTSFWYGEVNTYTLIPTDNNVEVLANLESVNNDYLGKTNIIYKNELGGKIAVLGHFFPKFFKSEENRWQFLNLIDYLTDNKYVRIDACCKFHIVHRAGKRQFVMITNTSLDDVCDFNIRIGNLGKQVFYVTENGLQRADLDGETLNIKLLKSYEYICLVVGE